MAKRGNKPLQKNIIETPKELKCLSCGGTFDSSDFYDSDSEFHSGVGKIPYCRECFEKFYQKYLQKYIKANREFPEKDAIERICMSVDIYYSDKVYEAAVKESRIRIETSLMSLYLKQVKLYQYRKKNYDSTITEKEKNKNNTTTEIKLPKSKNGKTKEELERINRAKIIFGEFPDDDLLYLLKEYEDWTSRHECNTKSQEEVFKDICFNRLQNLKALQKGEDTKDITASFQKMLDAGKLQPKQNHGDTTSETQTFGTLIDKWENEKPLPEIDEDLKDVDKIGLYLDVFFKGHLAKMMGLKNGSSNLYTKFMKKYTVEKPEYKDEENSEALFDSIFGNQSLDSKDELGVV